MLPFLLALSFTLADKLPPDSVFLLGLPVVTASREHTDPLFCSQVELSMTHTLTQLGCGVIPNPRYHLPEPYRHEDIPSRMLDLLVTLPNSGLQGLLEIDGERWHRHRRHLDEKRDYVLRKAGLKFIKRVSASRCFHSPYGVAEEFIQEMREFWSARRKALSTAVHR
jgi:hypothetical protein